ncbi:unnamed protein product [Penicillium discolor]
MSHSAFCRSRAVVQRAARARSRCSISCRSQCRNRLPGVAATSATRRRHRSNRRRCSPDSCVPASVASSSICDTTASSRGRPGGGSTLCRRSRREPTIRVASSSSSIASRLRSASSRSRSIAPRSGALARRRTIPRPSHRASPSTAASTSGPGCCSFTAAARPSARRTGTTIPASPDRRGPSGESPQASRTLATRAGSGLSCAMSIQARGQLRGDPGDLGPRLRQSPDLLVEPCLHRGRRAVPASELQIRAEVQGRPRQPRGERLRRHREVHRDVRIPVGGERARLIDHGDADATESRDGCGRIEGGASHRLLPLGVFRRPCERGAEIRRDYAVGFDRLQKLRARAVETAGDLGDGIVVAGVSGDHAHQPGRQTKHHPRRGSATWRAGGLAERVQPGVQRT